MEDKIKRIAKKIVSMDYSGIENLNNKYEQPEIMEDVVDSFGNLSKTIKQR